MYQYETKSVDSKGRVVQGTEHLSGRPTLSRGPASRQLVAPAATQVPATAAVSPLDRGKTPKVPFTTPVKTVAPTFPLCQCGCGETTKGGKYKPGHDSKYRSKIRNGGVVPPQVKYGKDKVKASGLFLVKGNKTQVV